VTDTHAPATPSRGRQALTIVAFLALAFVAGGVGSVIQGSDVGARYLALERPPWAPPAFLFGIVWPVLYVLIGLAGWKLWRTVGSVRAASTALTLWLVQLVVNAVWPGVFFGVEAFWPAVVVIVTLDVLVIATIGMFWQRDRIAALLLLPYLVWILYATALNVAIATLN